jgi:hypothetical protein
MMKKSTTIIAICFIILGSMKQSWGVNEAKVTPTDTKCEISKGQPDFIIKETMSISRNHEITTYLCSNKDSFHGWFDENGPPKDDIIGTRGIATTKKCDHYFFNNENKYLQFVEIKDTDKNLTYSICGGETDGYFIINGDEKIINDRKFLEVYFNGMHFKEHRIYLLDNLNHQPVVLLSYKSGYSLITKHGERKLKPKKEINLAPEIEIHFGIKLERSYVSYTPWI